MKLRSPLPQRQTRLEIIPLIDIMFFLLASFMLVSLSMVNMKGLKVNLPTATTATNETKKDFITVTVDKAGLAYLDAKLIGDHELVQALSSKHQADATLRVFISGDQDSRHGDMMRVLDLVRSAGIEKVAFETREISKP